MKHREHLQKLILCAAFAALTCLATLVIQVPSPLSGFMNLGDALVLTSAALLGPIYGTAAAGIGSCLADIISGYAIYAPATLVIKSLMALALCFFLCLIRRPRILACLLGGLAAESVMVLGYFAYDGFFLGYGLGAAVGIPANLMQAALGLLIAMFLIPLLKKIPYIFH